MTETVALSIGSNVGDRAENVAMALNRLKSLFGTITVSSIYETAPVEFTQQPSFLNCAVVAQVGSAQSGSTRNDFRSAYGAELLLDSLLAIEREMGRVRTIAKGPRVIDLDLLLYGDRVLNTPNLTLPHPAMHERRFVLVPLAEIAPNLCHPVLKLTVNELLKQLPEASNDAVERFASAPIPD